MAILVLSSTIATRRRLLLAVNNDAKSFLKSAILPIVLGDSRETSLERSICKICLIQWAFFVRFLKAATTTPPQRLDNVSQYFTAKFSFLPTVLLVSCILLLVSEDAFAQSEFRPPTQSPYSNGRLQQPSTSSGTFNPPSLKRRGDSGSSTKQATPSLSSRINQKQTSQSSDLPSIHSSRTNDTCYVEYVDEIEVPALEMGLLVEVNVKEGDTISSGSPIARIDDRIPRLQLKQAEVRITNANRLAEDATSIEAADKQIQLTNQRFQTTKRLEQKGARSPEERRTAQYEYEVAVLQKRAAIMRQLEAMGEASLEDARANEVAERIRRHNISAQFDGVVVERFKQQGEWVQAGESIVKVARMDKLYVTRLISNLEFNPSDVDGKRVKVTAELARGEKLEFDGKITVIGARDVSGKGNEYKIKAEVNNQVKQGQWVLRKNSRVSMEILE